MSEILRDSMWQFVAAAVLAILAILVSIGLYWKQRRRKALSYEIISRTPLLSVAEEVKSKLQILFDGKPVEQVHLIEVKIINSGNTPIPSTDFKRPINLSFGEEARILSTEITKTHPDSFQASVSVERERVVLTPILMNDGDTLTLRILVTQFANQIKVDGRIVGVKEIRESTKNQKRYFVLTLYGLVVQTGGVVGMNFVANTTWKNIFLVSIILGTGLGLISGIKGISVFRTVDSADVP